MRQGRKIHKLKPVKRGMESTAATVCLTLERAKKCTKSSTSLALQCPIKELPIKKATCSEDDSISAAGPKKSVTLSFLLEAVSIMTDRFPSIQKVGAAAAAGDTSNFGIERFELLSNQIRHHHHQRRFSPSFSFFHLLFSGQQLLEVIV